MIVTPHCVSCLYIKRQYVFLLRSDHVYFSNQIEFYLNSINLEFLFLHECTPSGLRQFLPTGSPLKMMKNAFHFIWRFVILLKRDSHTGFSLEYCKMFRNIYFEEHLRTAASWYVLVNFTAIRKLRRRPIQPSHFFIRGVFFARNLSMNLDPLKMWNYEIKRKARSLLTNQMKILLANILTNFTLHKKWSYPLRIFSVYVTKSAGNCYYRFCFHCYNSFAVLLSFS